MIEPQRARRRARSTELAARDAPARPAPRRPARPARGRTAPACAASRSCTSASAATRCARRAPRCSTTPSGARAPASRSWTTARTRPRTCSRPARATCELALRATVAGDELTLDFTGTAAQHEGNLNCPLAVTLSACYFAVRVLTDPDIPPSAGAYRPIDGRRAGGLPAQRALAGRGRRRATSRPPRGSPTSCCGVRPRARPGHDEQPHARQRRLHLLRDARRRPGRVRRRRRPERRARRDEQHAQHAGRGARARVPAAGGRVRAAPRLRRRPARTAAATAWSASSRRSRRCTTR